MICPICSIKIKNDKNYIRHLEKKHKNSNNCGCDSSEGGSSGSGGSGVSGVSSGGGEKVKIENILHTTMEKARKKVEMVEKSLNMNALEFGLKMGKKEIDKIPIGVRDKVQNLLLENQYLRGVVQANNKQIQIMKKHVDLCISQIGVHYDIHK